MSRDNGRSDGWGWSLLWTHLEHRRALAGQQIFTVTPCGWKHGQVVSDVELRDTPASPVCNTSGHQGSDSVLEYSSTSPTRLLSYLRFWNQTCGPDDAYLEQQPLRLLTHSIQHPHSMTYLDKRCCNCYQDKNLNSPPAVSVHSGSSTQFLRFTLKGVTKSYIMLNTIILCIKCNDYWGQFNDAINK